MGLGGQEDPLSPKRSKTQNTIKFLGLAFLEVSDLTLNHLRSLEGVLSEEHRTLLPGSHPPVPFQELLLRGREVPSARHNHTAGVQTVTHFGLIT